MAKGNPEIITGLKSPMSFPERQSGPAQAAGPDPVALAVQTADLAKPDARLPGEKVYHSRFRSIRIQVKTAQDRIDVATGTLIRGETQFAQFIDGEYRTTDPGCIAAIERCRSFLQGDIQDSDKVRLDAQRASFNTLVETVMGNPELLARLKADERLKKDLNLDDFPLPKQADAPQVRPRTET
ncbi:MAG: hypothetical protein A3E78_01985 [Alphaproteobacteria bacterium RIFCSPHIGHO2_12_FULL_63_12]|nr:MAG: hypothetical protein A3E78_01985 [Alphaproteobacteria bacterium RIFCSPHIGHO2_12_FULL_63_12]